MPAWLLPLLIQVLTDFLTWLFNRSQLVGQMNDISGSKDQFLAKVKWRIWYGKNRMQIAGQLFDQAAAKYKTDCTACKTMLDQKQYQQCADYLCADLTLN